MVFNRKNIIYLLEYWCRHPYSRKPSMVSIGGDPADADAKNSLAKSGK